MSTAVQAAPPDAHVSALVTLKGRWRVLRRVLPEGLAVAFDFAPALFMCSFDAIGFKVDTPGVEGVRYSGRWGRLASKLKVAAPRPAQSARCLVSGMLVLCEEGTARVLVMPSEAITTSLVAKVAERCAAATELYMRAKVPVRFELLRPGSLDAPTLARLFALGAVRCGRPAKWLTDAMVKAPVTDPARFLWAAHAPTAHCRVQLLLGKPPELEAREAEPFAALVALRRDLLRALRRAPLFDRPVFRTHLSRELLPGRVPQSLLPALRHATKDVTRRNPPHLKAQLSRAGVELRLPGGELFASARSLLQARVRAMLLAHALWGFVPETWVTGPQWKKLAQRLATDRARTTVLFALGSEGSALALKVKPGREPRMRELGPEATLRSVISSAAAGHQVEVVPGSQEHEVEAMRLSQIAWRVAAHANEPVSLEAGAYVLLFSKGRFRRFRAERFHARPRRAMPLDAQATRKSDGLGAVIECDAKLAGDHAVLAYRAKGWSFRESVSLDALQSHLQSTLSLSAAHADRPRVILSLDDGLEKHLKSKRAQSAPPCAIEVRGDLTRGLQLVIGGQTFAAHQLRAAAETVLSGWPVGIRGQLDVRHVSIGVGHAHADGLTHLYARALIARRLTSHIDSLVGLKGRRGRVEDISEG